MRGSMKSNRDGFTLAEILIVMLITSVLMLGVHAAHRQARLLWSQAEDGREAWYLARVLTETLREELCGLYLPPRNDADERPDMEAAFQLNSVPGETVDLSFFTVTPAWRTDVGPSPTARVCYRFSTDSDTGGPFLQRSERLCAGGTPIGVETSDVLVRDMAEFRVWVLGPASGGSQGSWTESYRSSERPPRAVKVRLRWHVGDRAGSHSRTAEFESVFVVPCESQLTALTNQLAR